MKVWGEARNGYNCDFGGRTFSQRWIVSLCIVSVCFERLINNTHRFSPDRFFAMSLVRPNRLRWRDYTRCAPANQLDDGIGDTKVSTILSSNCSFPKLLFLLLTSTGF